MSEIISDEMDRIQAGWDAAKDEIDALKADRDELRQHIFDIDAHATPYGDIPGEPGWVGTYLLTAGALHRALGKIGHSAPKCQAEAELAELGASNASLIRRVADLENQLAEAQREHRRTAGRTRPSPRAYQAAINALKLCAEHVRLVDPNRGNPYDIAAFDAVRAAMEVMATEETARLRASPNRTMRAEMAESIAQATENHMVALHSDMFPEEPHDIIGIVIREASKQYAAVARGYVVAADAHVAAREVTAAVDAYDAAGKGETGQTDWVDDAPDAEVRRRFDALPKLEVVTTPPATWTTRPQPGHDPGCTGGHTGDITCAAVAKLRADVAADPWHCPVSGMHHTFGGAEPGDPRMPLAARCGYGCGRTWGELEAARADSRAGQAGGED